MRVILGLFVLLLTAALAAEEPEKPVELTAAEQKFADMLTGTALVGQYSMDGRADRLAQTEAYWIESVKKTSGNDWVVTATMTYGNVKVPIPVPVQIIWAGDTPILQVTNLSIPLLGDGFSSRLLFYDGRYAGTWAHGKRGGHMWGKLERRERDAAPPEKPAEAP